MKSKARFKERLYWFHRRGLSKAFGFFHERNLPKINALLIFMYTKLHTFIKLKGIAVYRNKIHRILAFDRETFEKDLIEIAKRTELEIIFFPNAMYGSFFTAFLPLYFKDQVKYHTYNSPEELKLKGVLQDACNRIFPYLKKWFGFQAMISANIDYSQDQVWIEAGKKFGIPFVAVVKEGVQSDTHYDWWIEHFSNLNLKFRGHKMSVFCKRKKETLLKAGVAKEEDIFVAGAPRTDLLFDTLNSRNNTHLKNWVVLFTFNYRSYNRYVLWHDTLLSFAKAASNFSLDNKMKFVIKAKDELDKKETEQILNNAALLEYVMVKNNISFDELAKSTLLAVGYNTTAIIEMMATDIPIIVPHWAEAVDDPLNNMLEVDSVTSAYEIAKSPDDLIDEIKIIISSHTNFHKECPEFRTERDKIIEKFIYRIDGKRSQAIADTIRQCIFKNI